MLKEYAKGINRKIYKFTACSTCTRATHNILIGVVVTCEWIEGPELTPTLAKGRGRVVVEPADVSA